MEDFEKYVFDPENPTAFKAYDLLLKLSEQKPNAAFFDRDFFIELYKDFLFGDGFKTQLWDIPKNYDTLSISQRINLYVKNYSDENYYEYLDAKLTELAKTSSSLFIKSYLTFYKKRQNIFIQEYENNKGVNNHFRLLNHVLYDKSFSYDGQELLNMDADWSYNSIYFLGQYHISFLDGLKKMNKVAILITLKSNFVRSNDLKMFLNEKPNFKPIFLEKIDDVHRLVDTLSNHISLSSSFKSTETNQKPILPVQSLTLKNYFTIKNIQLENLQDKKEIYFLGKNGVGKTKLLQAILLAIRGNPNEGIVSDVIKENPNERLSLISTLADGTEFKYQLKPKKEAEIYKNIIAYGVNRFRNDSEQKDDTGFLTLFDQDQYLNSPVQWLKYLDYKELKQDFSGINLERAKALIKDILEDITEIEVSPEGVIFYEKNVPKSFKALSDGFKTLITWLCDMTIRLAEKQTHVTSTKDFLGIVLVDEIGMFLHPTWQYSLMKKLRNQWFPNIQFVFTTHSPIEILGASSDAVFYKLYKEDGITKVSKPVENKSISHLMLNGIVTAPFLFGLPSAKQAAFNEKTDNLDTSDDYYIGRIREELLRRVTEKEHVNQDDIMNLLSDAFDSVEKELVLNDKN